MILLTLALIILGGCSRHDFSRQDTGTVIGAGLGGLGGAQIGSGTGRLIATGIGTLFGAAVGSELGRAIDEVDRQRMKEATHNALEYTPTRERVEWQGREARGWVEPTRTFKRSDDMSRSGWSDSSRRERHATSQYCREFQTVITVGGKTRQGYGTACRQPDGSWEILQ